MLQNPFFSVFSIPCFAVAFQRVFTSPHGIDKAREKVRKYKCTQAHCRPRGSSGFVNRFFLFAGEFY